MRRFVIADIHGRIEALLQVLQQSNFDYDDDKLIVLGDVNDGGKDTFLVVEELLKIKNLIFVLGNHDELFIRFMNQGFTGEIWIQQGGSNTLRSYGAEVIVGKDIIHRSHIDTSSLNIPVTHQLFFNSAIPYYIEDNMLFVHGGYDPELPIEENKLHTLLWDRELIKKVIEGYEINDYRRVYVGHTATSIIANKRGFNSPIILKNLRCVDCGSGWDGKLCLTDIDTEEVWLSDRQIPAIEVQHVQEQD